MAPEPTKRRGFPGDSASGAVRPRQRRPALRPRRTARGAVGLERILAFQAHYNAHAIPFGWNYTRDDLNDLL